MPSSLTKPELVLVRTLGDGIGGHWYHRAWEPSPLGVVPMVQGPHLSKQRPEGTWSIQLEGTEVRSHQWLQLYPKGQLQSLLCHRDRSQE